MSDMMKLLYQKFREGPKVSKITLHPLEPQFRPLTPMGDVPSDHCILPLLRILSALNIQFQERFFTSKGYG